MKSFLLILFLTLGVASTCLAQQSGTLAVKAGDEEAALSILAPPPASLDNLYPPKAPAPVFLIAMLDLAESLTGISVNLFENDPDNARLQYEKFKSKYEETSRLVPEWTDYYPMDAVEKLGSTLASHNPDQVMAAMDEMDQVCARCHVAYMAKTQQKYYWPNFDEITLTDPVSGQSVPYRQFMFFLASSFEGIGIDLKEGQMENAAKHHADFDKRQQALKENCAACHDTDRKYFVDESVQTMINRLGDALASGSPDANNVSNLCQGIGMESCYKCHAVHMPSALANDGWKTSRVVHGK